MIEKTLERAFAVIGVALKPPFRLLDYREALRRFGSDKPDLRFGMELRDVTAAFEDAREKMQLTGNVQAIVAPGAAGFSRKQLDELAETAKSLGAKSLFTAKVTAEGVQSPLEKTLGAEKVKELAALAGAQAGDLILAVAAREQTPGDGQRRAGGGTVASAAGGTVETDSAGRWEFAWITGFPLFEWSDTEKRWVSAQHPFTGIVEEDLDKLETAPQECRSKGYDLVLNGVELGSGSIRIHRQDIQERLFRALGLSAEEARQRFGFFLDALTYRHSSARRHRAGH